MMVLDLLRAHWNIWGLDAPKFPWLAGESQMLRGFGFGNGAGKRGAGQSDGPGRRVAAPEGGLRDPGEVAGTKRVRSRIRNIGCKSSGAGRYSTLSTPQSQILRSPRKSSNRARKKIQLEASCGTFSSERSPQLLLHGVLTES